MTATPARLRLPRRREPAAEETFNRRLIAPMILGSVLNPVNSSMIAVSLVPIGVAFGAPPSQTAWLVSALYLATAIGQPVVGRLVDAFGPRRLYLAGTSLAGIAGILGALAPTLGVLVAARVLLGFGTCAGYPAAMSLIRSESRRTGRDNPAAVLTMLSVANQTIAVVGPTVGGLLIGLGGWRTIFTVNIPLSLACLVLGTLRLPRRPRRPDPGRDPGTGRLAGIDLAGIALFAAMLTALLLFLMNPRAADWYLLALAAGAAAGFAARELRAAQPFIDLRVLGGNLPLLATFGRTLLTFTVSYGFLYGYTQWLEEGRGLSASAAGLVQLPTFLTAIIISTTTGRRRAVRGKLLVGSTAQVAACALLLLLHPASTVWLLVGVAVAAGIPRGLNSLANQNALYHQAEPARTASSAGLLRTFTYLGAMASSAANAAFFHHHADTGGLHHLALFMLAIAALLLVASLADRSLRRVGRPESSPAGPRLAVTESAAAEPADSQPAGPPVPLPRPGHPSPAARPPRPATAQVDEPDGD